MLLELEALVDGQLAVMCKRIVSEDEFRKELAGEPTETRELRGFSLAGLEKTIAS